MSKEEKKESKDEISFGDDFVATDSGETPLFLTEVFGALYGKEAYSDVTLIIGKGKERIPAHRIVLATASPVFSVMLYPTPEFTDQKLPSPFEVSLPSVDPSSFKLLLQCIYSDDLKIDTSQIHGLINLAKKYQVEKVSVICGEYLSSDVGLENACELFELAPVMLGDPEFGLPFIRENTEDVIATEGFLKLSSQRLKDLLSDDQLSAEEAVLYTAVQKWGKAKLKASGKKETPDEIKGVIGEILPSIRFPLMPLDVIAGQIAPSGILPSEQLLELFKFCSLTDAKEREEAGSKLGWSWKERQGAGGIGIEKESKILTKKVMDKKTAAAFSKFFLPIGAKPNTKPKVKFTLLYRGSRDGFSGSTFHSRCDGKGPSITIIKASGRSNIFGGYCGESWNSSSGYSSGRAWLFSLVNPQNRPVRLENLSGSTSNNIYHNSSYGPTWGAGHDLHVNSSMTSTSNYCSPNSYMTVTTGFDTVSVNNTLLGGAYNWTVEEIEVFGLTGYTY